MKEQIIETIKAELYLHPEATLFDIYKNFFQGRFGPGHMIQDKQKALEYLEHEITEASQFDKIKLQPVGYSNQFIRVNLSLVQEGKLALNQLAHALYESANTATQPNYGEWIGEWKSILKIIEAQNLTVVDFEEHQIQIEKNLLNGQIIGHHSPIYREKYNPHYRVIHREFLDGLELY